MLKEFDIIIIGGGPAGLSAALDCAKVNARTLLIDEFNSLGGQYYQQRSLSMTQRYGAFRPEGTRLVQEVRQSKISIAVNTLVWAVFNDKQLELFDKTTGEFWQAKAKAIIIATGTLERHLPFKGWTLPGVVTLGFALHTATRDHVPVGKRIVVAGSGPLIPVLAFELSKLGAHIVEIAEAIHLLDKKKSLLLLSLYPSNVTKAISMYLYFLQHKITYNFGTIVLQAKGNKSVEEVELANVDPRGEIIPGSTRTVPADSLCVGFGFRSSFELIKLFGCNVCRDTVDESWHPRINKNLETSVNQIYAAGDVLEIGGVHVAKIQGHIAGISALKSIGFSTPIMRLRHILLSGAMYYLNGYIKGIKNIYKMPIDLVRYISDDVVVCRCEGTTAGDIRSIVDFVGPDLGACKRLSRAGMGICQGRMCMYAVENLIADHANVPPTDVVGMTQRNPIKPVQIGDLIRSHAKNTSEYD
jgi:thioredoxin reductase